MERILEQNLIKIIARHLLDTIVIFTTDIVVIIN